MRSDAQHIALERARVTCNVLRKSAFWREQMSHNDSIMRQLLALRSTLRNSDAESFDPAIVIAPFVSVIREAYLAGPYKLIALDTIQTLLSCNILLGCRNACDTLTEIVDAVTRCKFVQTDAVGDDLVTLRLVQVLHEVIKSHMKFYLNDASAWDIVESCYAVLIRGPHRSSLSQVAEQTLFDTVRYIFSNLSPTGGGSKSLGFPCAVKLLAFFVNVLKKHTIFQQNSRAPGGEGSNAPDPSADSSSEKPALIPSAQFLGDLPPDAESSQIVLAIKIISCMLLSEGDISVPRETILKCRPLVSLVRDDLGLCLILLASRADFPPVVLQSVLSLFSTVVFSLGPLLYVLVEAFLVHVYMKGLNQLLNLLTNVSMENKAQSSSGGSDVAGDGPYGVYSIEQLEVLTFLQLCSFDISQLIPSLFATAQIILESLMDTLSDCGFLSMIFISFDCDPCRVDILQPVVSYLCKCARYALCIDDSVLQRSNLDVITNLALQCLSQIVSALADRCGTVFKMPTEVREPTSESNYTLSLEIRATRASKKILSEAARRFTVKPEHGLSFLQSLNALPTPLTPKSVAKFLRISSDLPKEVVGSYLGELGKDNPKFEGDGKEFHKNVLEGYIDSFPFSGLTILSSVRVFLSAFRLPGEAQQIDRILNAFSEHCFACCVEKDEGIIENPEIAYVLSFSIIMLNTDRHNVNIRADRKMTLDQFVKNNTNYGADLKQTKPLPRDYLESIYHSISNFPLRTEKRDETGSITMESWMDAQQIASLNVEKGLLLTICHGQHTLSCMKHCVYDLSSSTDEKQQSRTLSVKSADSSEDKVRSYHPNLEAVSQHAIKIVSQLLSSEFYVDVFELSSNLYGQQSLIDADLAECIWKDLLPVIASPFLVPYKGRKFVSEPEHDVSSFAPLLVSESNISTSLGLAMATLKITNWYKIPLAGDAIVVLLADFAKLIDLPNRIWEIGKRPRTGDSVADLGPNRLRESGPAMHESDDVIYDGLIDRTKRDPALKQNCLAALVSQRSARAALFALLKLANKHPDYLSEFGWTVYFHGLCLLRDVQMLPISMVLYNLNGSVYDTLPTYLRSEFEMLIDESDSPVGHVKLPTMPTENGKSKKSILSLQGLGEALFGATDADDVNAEEAKSHSIMSGEKFDNMTQKSESGNSKLILSALSRWDLGYVVEDISNLQTNSNEVSSKNQMITSPTKTIDRLGSPLTEPAVSPIAKKLNVGTTIDVSELKKLIAQCGVAELITDSKFVEDEVLLRCTRAILSLSDYSSGWGLNEPTKEKIEELATIFDWSWDGHYSELSEIRSLIEHVLLSIAVPSMASTSWLENVQVEFVLRNRDRIGVLWTSLAVHYIRSAVALCARLEGIVNGSKESSAAPLLVQPLGMPSSRKQPNFGFSYIDERRVVGLLKISSKMFSRAQQVPRALNLLHGLLCGVNAVAVENYCEWFGLENYDGDVEDACSMQFLSMSSAQRSLYRTVRGKRGGDFLKPWPRHVIRAMTAQISIELWQMLTLNVSTLSHLQLSQWQQLFDIIAIVSAGDAFSAGKAYEIMAWLIHEPRLRGEVPVFSLSGVRPLLNNTKAHDSIAIGAIHLLSNLHDRLEVLVKSEDTQHENCLALSGIAGEARGDPSMDLVYRELNDANNSSALWESCWVPILQVMSGSVLDRRPRVQSAAARALSASLHDRHSHVVPADVIITILSTVLIHTVSQLNDRLLERQTNESTQPVTSLHSHQTSEEVLDSSWAIVEKRDVQEKELPGLVSALESERMEAIDYSINEPNTEASVSAVNEEMLTALYEFFRTHLLRIRNHPLFEYVWLSTLRVMLFYEEYSDFFAKPDSTGTSEEFPLHLATKLIKKLLDDLDGSGMFIVALEESRLLSHRPVPPPSRNKLWFATSCEISKVVEGDKAKRLFPKFVLPIS